MTMQSLVQMFREAEGFTMTPEQTLVICMLNTIQDKKMMIKVQEHITEDMPWEEVRNVIVKLDRAAHLSDIYCQNNRKYAVVTQNGFHIHQQGTQ